MTYAYTPERTGAVRRSGGRRLHLRVLAERVLHGSAHDPVESVPRRGVHTRIPDAVFDSRLDDQVENPQEKRIDADYQNQREKDARQSTYYISFLTQGYNPSIAASKRGTSPSRSGPRCTWNW